MNIFKRFQKSVERLKSLPIEEFRKEEGQLNIDLTVFLQIFSEFVLVLSIVIVLFAALIQEPADIIIELHGLFPRVSAFISAAMVSFAGVTMLILRKIYYPRVCEDIAEHPEAREEYGIDITGSFDGLHIFRVVILLFTLGILIGVSAPTEELREMILAVSFMSAILPFLAALVVNCMLKIQHRKYVEEA